MRDSDDSQDDADGKMRRGVDRYEAARRSWEYFQTGEARPEPVENAPQAAHGQGDFDSSEFLEGAKIFFSRFQEAGDNRDLDSIRDFISDEVYAQAVADLETGGVAARTEIMLLDARLVDVRTENGTTSVTVQFDADLRKGISGGQREHVRTVWEFSRDETAPGSLWTLDKINRMDH
ncbi:Tim44 domain-containing protein [Pseudodesulfovibrio tunisiensis]|uniref:Tim44 domain-containing protein n=1 Tax=Pseudodesulfovibrio tunisiensis TaxID=463192 RepID=UPI001FB3662A|nr:Tim44-like domain-containing protein [Pseudodesulfovibrio tunisiensis]